MKKLNLLSLLFAVLVTTISCSTESKSSINEARLSESDSVHIVKKVIEATDLFATANNQLDAKEILNYWHYYNPDFIVVENTTIHPSGEVLKKAVTAFYTAGIDSTNLNWTKRDVLPLSTKFAHLIGEYDYYLKLKTGEKMNYHIYYSALFKEMDGNWKALRVHESYTD